MRDQPPAAAASGGFAVIDVETTGFSPTADRIVEVGVVLLDADGTAEGTFATLLDPGRDPGPTHVHGITAAMVAGAPGFAAIRPYLAHLLSGRVVVGHNVERFDLGFVRAECARAAGRGAVPDGLAVVDTLRVAQGLLNMRGQARLVDCCDRFGLSWADHHSALGDCQVTASLFQAMRNALGDAVLELERALASGSHIRWPDASGSPVATRTRADVLTG